MIIGDRIKLLRKSNDITQDELAKKLFVSYQLISKWERNISEPTVQMLFTIINSYSLPLDFFMENSTDKQAKDEKNTILSAFVESMYQSIDTFPTFTKISRVANIPKINIEKHFANEDELVYTFINSVDNNIRINLTSQMKLHKNIIDIFINDMAPLLYDKRFELHLLYGRNYIKNIWILFIKNKYKNMIQTYYNAHSINNLDSEYLVDILTAFISVWMSQPNPEPLEDFQFRIKTFVHTPIHDWPLSSK